MATILVEILGNSKQFKSELDSAVASTHKANGGFAKMSKAAGVAGLALTGGLAFGLVKSVEAADEMQQSTARMNAAFARSHVSVKAFAGRIEEAESKSRKLGFSNDQVRGSLGSLVIATHDGAKAIKDLGVAQDIARFKHVSLETATKTLTMAMAGSQRAVKQLGIAVTKTTEATDAAKASYKSHLEALKAQFPATAKQTAAEHQLYLKKKNTLDINYAADKALARVADTNATAAKVIATVSDKLHGQAKAFSDTAAGGMAQFHAQLSGVAENLGMVLLPALTSLATALADGASFFSAHTTLAKGLVIAIGALAAVLLTVSVATKLIAAAQAIWVGVQAAATAGVWLMNAALAANPIGIVIIAVAALVAGIVIAYQHSATFRAIVTGAFDAVKTAARAVLNFFRDSWAAIKELITGPFDAIVDLARDAFGVRSAISGAFRSVVDWFKDNWVTIIAAVILSPFAPLVLIAGNAFGIRDKLEGAFSSMKTAIGNAIDDVVGFVKSLPGRIVGALGNVSTLLYNAGASIIQGLIDGMTSKLADVKNLAGSIAGKIASLKGPLEADRVLLVPHGQAIIQGLQAGLASGLDGLNRMTAGIAPTISQTVASAPLSAPAGGGGGVTVNLTVNGWVGDKQALVEQFRNEMIRLGRNTTGGALGGFA